MVPLSWTLEHDTLLEQIERESPSSLLTFWLQQRCVPVHKTAGPKDPVSLHRRDLGDLVDY